MHPSDARRARRGHEPADHGGGPRTVDRHFASRTRLLIALGCGVVVLLGCLLLTPMTYVLAGVITWIVFASVYTGTTWHRIHHLSPEQVRDHATAEEPGLRASHLTLIAASIGSLLGVGVLLVAGAGMSHAVPVAAIGGTLAVAASWFLVHMLFTLRYATYYYSHPGRPVIDFNGTTDPDYQDFAYFSYNLGMTYQVSDTAVTSRGLRRIVLHHCLLSYLLGAVVVATTINLVVQLAQAQLGG